MIRMTLLGATELTRDDGVAVGSVLAQPKRLALLVYLALHRPRGFVRREHLMALFWPEKDDAHARNALRQSLHFLRRSLGKEAFESRGDGEIALVADRFRVDVWELDGAGDPEVMRDLWRGPLLEGFNLGGSPEFDDWLDGERARLRRVTWQKLLDASDAAARGGDAEKAVAWARFAVDLRPMDEAGSCRLMELLARHGHRAAAIAEFERLDAALEEGIGHGAADETRRLVEEIQAGTASGEEVDTTPDPAAPDPADDPEAAAVGARQGLPIGRTAAILALVVVPWALTAGPESSLVREGPVAPSEADPLPPVWLLTESTRDSATSGVQQALLETLRIDLNETPGVAVLPRSHEADALRRMRRRAEEPLDRGLALGLARRDGLAGVVQTTVRQAGSGYLLTAEILDRDGAPRGQYRTTAEGRSDLMPAFERLSSELRERLALIRTTPRPPLPPVTTRSLEALEHYALARAGGPTNHLEQATALDPDFAMAWLERGRRLRGNLPLAAPFLQRAWDLRREVSRVERHEIEFTYHELLTGDQAAAAAASDAFIAVNYGAESTWLRQQVLLAFPLREFTEVLRLSLRKRTVDGRLGIPDWWNLITAQAFLGDEAGLAGSLAEAPDPMERLRADLRLAFQRQDWDETLRLTREAAADMDREWPNGPYWEAFIHLGAGRLSEARGELDRHRRLSLALEQRHPVANLSTWFALAEIHLAGDTARALQHLTRAEDHVTDPAGAAVLRMAWGYAEVGRVERATNILAGWEATMEGSGVPRARWPRNWWVTRAAIALAEGRASEAVALLEEAIRDPVGQPFDCMFCPDLLMARALDRVGRSDAALEYHRRVAESHMLLGEDRQMDAVFLVPTRERMAEIYEERGEIGEAARQYREILRVWADAGPELRPRLEAARAGLSRLGGR